MTIFHPKWRQISKMTTFGLRRSLRKNARKNVDRYRPKMCGPLKKKAQQSIEIFRFKMSIVIEVKCVTPSNQYRYRRSMTIDILAAFFKSQQGKSIFNYFEGRSLLIFF